MIDKPGPSDVQTDTPTVDLTQAPPDDSPTLVRTPRPGDSSGLNNSHRAAGDSSGCAPGKRLGKYELLELAGRGGMGEVWKARDTELKRTVAVKRLPWASGQDIERLRRVAQFIGKLSHPNIAPLYEFQAEPPFLAMQFIDGTSIDRASGDRIAHLRDAARAVHYAHSQGILHRDLKPANIMVSRDGQVYVLDFGLARELQGELTAISRTGDLLGTPSYMAPEQANGESQRIGPHTDVYGLGATLYALLAGRAPFSGATTYSILKKVIEQDPPSPGGNADLQTIALKALEKDPAKRYASALEMGDDLQRYLDNEPIMARPASAIYRLRKRIQRRPLVAFLMLLIVVGIGFELGLLAWKNRQLDQANRELAGRNTALDAERERLRLQGELHQIAQRLALHEDALARSNCALNEIYDDLNALLDRLAELGDQHTEEGALRYLRARALLLLQREAQAIEEFSAALQSAQDTWPNLNSLAYFGRAEAQLLLVQDLLMQSTLEGSTLKNEIDTVVERMLADFRLAGEGDLPEVPRTLAELWIQFNREELYDIVAEASRQIAHGGRSEAFYLLRGLARPLHEREKSIEDFRASLALYWAQPRVHFLLGKFSEDLTQGQPHHAEADNALLSYGAAIRLKPDYWLAYHRRGRLHLERGEAELAIADYEKVRELKPDFAEAHFYLAVALRKQGSWQAAVEHFDTAASMADGYTAALIESSRTKKLACEDLLALAETDDRERQRAEWNQDKAEFEKLVLDLQEQNQADEQLKIELMAGAEYLVQDAYTRAEQVHDGMLAEGGALGAPDRGQPSSSPVEDAESTSLRWLRELLFADRNTVVEAPGSAQLGDVTVRSGFAAPPAPDSMQSHRGELKMLEALAQNLAQGSEQRPQISGDEVDEIVTWELGLGEQLLIEQRLEEASKAGQLVTRLNGRESRGHLLHGDALALQGDFAGAEAAYTRALERGARELALLQRRVLVRVAQGDQQGAEEDAARLQALLTAKATDLDERGPLRKAGLRVLEQLLADPTIADLLDEQTKQLLEARR